MRKEAQLSVFILLGIILLAMIVFITSLVFRETEPGPALPDGERTAIKNYVEQCVELTALDAFVDIGQKGGYYTYPPGLELEPESATPYYFDAGASRMPSTEVLQSELGQYIDDNLELCTEELTSNLTALGGTIGTAESRVILTEDGAHVDVTLPIDLHTDSGSISFDSFSSDISGVRLLTIHDAIADSLDSEMLDTLCTSCLLSIGERYDLTFVAEKRNGTASITVFDNNSLIDGEPYAFSYSNRYLLPSCDKPPQDADVAFYEYCLEQRVAAFNDIHPFIVQDVPSLTAVVGKAFNYTINASGLGLEFSDVSPLFDIDPKTGSISFVPTPTDRGEYDAVVSVADAFGNEEYLRFNLTIAEAS
jgi:hypothetical protein